MPPLTYAPLPKWSSVASALLSRGVDEQELAKPWLQSGSKAFWFSRSAWSLYAVCLFRQFVKERQRINVWLPSYFCNASLVPLNEPGINLSFYPLSEDGQPDFEACQDLLKRESPDLFIVVHYFGLPTDGAEICKFLKKTDAWLVEDAAHVLLPGNEIGEFGDFVLYSPHKILAIPDGALLVINTGRRNITEEMLEQYDFGGLYHSLTQRPGKSSLMACLWLAKRMLQKVGIRSLKMKIVGFNEDDAPTASGQLQHPSMSPLAKRILATLIGNLVDEVAQRKINRMAWIRALNEVESWSSRIKVLEATDTPYLAGFSCESNELATEMYDLLVSARIPVSSWPDLPLKVRQNPERFEKAVAMRGTRLFFPVHGSIDAASISSAIKKLRFFGGDSFVSSSRG